jgi:hypothetical protein
MAEPKANNTRLVQFRKYHSWGGVALAGFILMVCATGLYLNHKDLFDGKKKASPEADSLLTTTTRFDAVPVGFDKALALAHGRWGAGPIEKIELKDEHGRLVYKVKQAEGGEELIVDANTADVAVKAGYGTGGGINWGKLIEEIHTGKVGGLAGKLVIDVTALVIVGLTLTGVYLWWVPLARKRRSAKQREEAARLKAEAVAV